MRQSLLLLSSLILTMLLLGFVPTQSGHESTLFGIEAQVSDIKNHPPQSTIYELSQQYLLYPHY